VHRESSAHMLDHTHVCSASMLSRCTTLHTCAASAFEPPETSTKRDIEEREREEEDETEGKQERKRGGKGGRPKVVSTVGSGAHGSFRPTGFSKISSSGRRFMSFAFLGIFNAMVLF